MFLWKSCNRRIAFLYSRGVSLCVLNIRAAFVTRPPLGHGAGRQPRPRVGGWGFGRLLAACGWLAAAGFGWGTNAGAAEVTAAPVPTRTQVIELRQGWNAVFLEVEPGDSSPAAVFAGLPVDIAAAFLSPATPAQFISNPSADLLRRSGWRVWYSPDRADGFLANLHAVHGQQAYLVHATANATWRAAGAVRLPEVQWQADTFNFVGFPVSPQNPPTFAQYFAASPAHRHDRIYRLVEGVWQKVADPSAQSMRSGEAFWIFCAGSSRFRGPVVVDTPSSQGLVLGRTGGELIIRNASGNPLTPTLENVILGPGSLPLSLVVRAVGDPKAPIRDLAASTASTGWIQPLPTLEAGGALRIPIAAQLPAMTAYVQTTALRVTTDLGTETWVPVVGLRADLKRN